MLMSELGKGKNVLAGQNLLLTLSRSDGSGRKPKLFFVSSSSTVTTIQTSTFCYVTASPAAPTGLTTCSRKKRRSILKEADDFLPEFEPEPSKTSDVEPSMDESVSERFVRSIKNAFSVTMFSY